MKDYYLGQRKRYFLIVILIYQQQLQNKKGVARSLLAIYWVII